MGHPNPLHVIPSPHCLCGHGCEDPLHFFFNCPRFDDIRLDMFNNISAVTQKPIDLKMLLHGDDSLELHANKRIFDSIHLYLKESKRFD